VSGIAETGGAGARNLLTQLALAQLLHLLAIAAVKTRASLGVYRAAAGCQYLHATLPAAVIAAGAGTACVRTLYAAAKASLAIWHYKHAMTLSEKPSCGLSPVHGMAESEKGDRDVSWRRPQPKYRD